VVAVDGCSSACGARFLEAHGVTPVAALTLDDVHADGRPVGEVVAEAGAFVDRGVVSRRVRRLAPPSRSGSPRAHTVEDYLVAIAWLTSPIGPCGALVENTPTLAAHVSTLLSVSRPTAGEALNRLERQGLIQRGASKELLLTASGRTAADRAVRAHRILECFTVDMLGYDLTTCFVHARQLAPSFDAEAVERLARSLGSPDRCPHGWPVDEDAARTLAATLVSLAALAAGAQAVVELIPENGLGWVGEVVEAGLVPGTPVVLAGAESGSVTVEVRGRAHRLHAAAAGSVLVRPL
jgi:DtxR family Mn-dependent transcriptional regulator